MDALQDNSKEIALCKAIYTNNLPEIKRLIGAGANVNLALPLSVYTSSKSHTEELPPLLALFKLVISSKEPIVRLLLAAGADPNSSTKRGLSPLYYAAVSGSSAIIFYLLNAGANPNYQLVGSIQSALGLVLSREDNATWEIDYDEDKLPIITKLLKHGADPNAIVKLHGYLRPLHLAAQLLDVDCALALLEAGADPDPPNLPFTPLVRVFSSAVRLDPETARIPRGIVTLVSTLLLAGADPNALLRPPQGISSYLSSVISFCSQPASVATRTIIKCLSLVIVAARENLSLPNSQVTMLIILMRNYLKDYQSVTKEQLRASEIANKNLLELALCISPVCYGDRLL